MKKDLNKRKEGNNSNKKRFKLENRDVLILLACVIGGAYIGNYLNNTKGGLIGLFLGVIVFYFYYKNRM